MPFKMGKDKGSSTNVDKSFFKTVETFLVEELVDVKSSLLSSLVCVWSAESSTGNSVMLRQNCPNANAPRLDVLQEANCISIPTKGREY